ncbi:MAG: NAD(P)H-dependent oxidoreductase subunit E [Desulfobacteraceae bacterium]|nr:MAG: NAD(P)H-dependent oxidoreductase subunit E [Desulfobacteraceae bacterium]
MNDKNFGVDYRELDRIIEDEYQADGENLIMMLQAIQNRYNFLPRPALYYLSEKLAIPYSKIYGVGTFYSTFSLEPRGRNIVSICLGTACHVRGGERIKERIEAVIHNTAADSQQGLRFSMEPVRCIGCCSLGPVVKVNEDIHSRITPDEVETILEKYE